nr:hypothetical protein [Rubripirellula sp.]
MHKCLMALRDQLSDLALASNVLPGWLDFRYRLRLTPTVLANTYSWR